MLHTSLIADASGSEGGAPGPERKLSETCKEATAPPEHHDHLTSRQGADGLALAEQLGTSQPIFDAAEAARHCQTIGLELEKTRLRAIHWNAANMKEEEGKALDLPPRDKRRRDLEGLQRKGYRLYLIAGGGKKDEHVQTLSHCWAEWDGLEQHEVLGLLAEFGAAGLPDPTLVLSTWKQGSIHVWWQLEQPCTDVQRWRQLMGQLVHCLDSDRNCVNPSRLMRLAGSAYWGKAGKPHAGELRGQARILDAETTEATCTLEDLERFTASWMATHPDIGAFVTADGVTSADPPTEKERAEFHASKGHQLPPVRPLEHIEALLDAIPKRESGLPDGNYWKYPRHRYIACGLRDALYRLYQQGCTDDPDRDAAEHAEKDAIRLMEQHSPSKECSWHVGQVVSSSAWLDEGNFWKVARHVEDFNLPPMEQPKPAAVGDPDAAVPAPKALRQELGQALAAGTSGAELEILQQRLATNHNLHPLAVKNVAAALVKEALAADSIEAEARSIAVEADRQQIGKALNLGYLLPEPIAAAIEARTRYMPVEGPSAALMFLCGVAAAARLGTQVVGSAASGLVVPTNLYGCAVARSGAMKSPAGKAVIRDPLHPLAVSLRMAYEQRLEDWRQQCRDTPKGQEKPPAPQPSHLIASDPTGEALVATLQQNEAEGLGLLLYRDELAGLFGGLNQYRGGRGSDRELLLELFDGGGMAQLRVVGGGRFFNSSQFSIYGTTQPEVLHELVAEGDPSGLWARFVFAPVPAVAVRLPDDDDDTEACAAADTLVRVAHAVHHLKPRPYRLDSAGAARFREYHYNRQQAALAATLPAHGALYGKAAGKVLRVAGLIHLAAIGAGTTPDTGPIPDATVERAVMLVDHLDSYALGIHTDAAGAGPSGVMRAVHRIAEGAAEALSPNQVRKQLSQQQRQAWEPSTVGAAMEALARSGYGELVEGARGTPRYRATRGLP